jgi:Tfp pilus assembly PilM family ATPase
MPEEILSLDISSDSVSAVKVTRKLKEHHVTACDHVMIEEGGLEEALKALVERVGPGEVCFSSLPGEHVSYRNLRMPFRDKKKIRQTLLFELETIIPFPVASSWSICGPTTSTPRFSILAACQPSGGF